MSTSPQLTEQQAFLGIAMSIAGADGRLTMDEIEDVVNFIARMEMFHDQDVDVDGVYDLLKEHGVDAFTIAASDKLSQPIRETAFALAVEVAMSDGDLGQEEMTLIKKLIPSLKIDESIAHAVVTVMEIRSRG